MLPSPSAIDELADEVGELFHIPAADIAHDALSLGTLGPDVGVIVVYLDSLPESDSAAWSIRGITRQTAAFETRVCGQSLIPFRQLDLDAEFYPLHSDPG